MSILVPVILIFVLILISVSSKNTGFHRAKMEEAKKTKQFLDEIMLAYDEKKIDARSAKEIIRILNAVYVNEWRMELLKKSVKKLKNIKKVPIETDKEYVG